MKLDPQSNKRKAIKFYQIAYPGAPSQSVIDYVFAIYRGD